MRVRVVLVLLYDRNEHVFETVQSSEVLENLMIQKDKEIKLNISPSDTSTSSCWQQAITS